VRVADRIRMAAAWTVHDRWLATMMLGEIAPGLPVVDAWGAGIVLAESDAERRWLARDHERVVAGLHGLSDGDPELAALADCCALARCSTAGWAIQCAAAEWYASGYEPGAEAVRRRARVAKMVAGLELRLTGLWRRVK
jgi:hypothetical protein